MSSPFRYVRLRTLTRVALVETCSVEFLQAMLNRMIVSHFKYGNVSDCYPGRYDPVKNAIAKLREYQRTGNGELLVDAANYAMIEAMRPRHPRYHWATGEGTGREDRV